MEQYVFLTFWVFIFVVQMVLCVLSKPVIVKLLPVIVLVAVMVAFFAVYVSTQNWAYLILIVIAFIGLLIAGVVWAAYGIMKLTKNMIALSRKNT